MTRPTRRDFVKDAALVGAAALVSPRDAIAATRDAAHTQPPALPPMLTGSLDAVARDEAYWAKVAAQYAVTDEVINLEAGYFGIMAAPVLAAYHRHLDQVNRESSFFARRKYGQHFEAARNAVAQFVGAKPTELVLSRGATEALQALIVQYKPVGAGDTVMYSDLDYNAMQWSMNALAASRGAKVATFNIPEPASRANVLEAYTKALDANPRTKLLLLTHCNNKTGLIIPVAEITKLAKARGADVVVDAAHSFGQVPLTMDTLGADFVGLNLHKWIGAPVGAGAMYIRDGRLDAIDRMHADESAPLSRIESRLHTGTTNFATVMAIPDAIAFQQKIGMAQKGARLRYLRDTWVRGVRGVAGVDVLTPDEAGMVGALTSFRLKGKTDRASNERVVNELLEKHRIFTYWRTGVSGGDCVRVTPTLFNSVKQVEMLAGALKAMA